MNQRTPELAPIILKPGFMIGHKPPIYEKLYDGQFSSLYCLHNSPYPEIKPPMVSCSRRLISSLSAIALVSTQITSVYAQAPVRAPYGTDLCQNQTEAGFRSQVQKITETAITRGISNVNYTALVLDAWRKGDLDNVINRQVDTAVAEVADESSWKDLVKSLASRQKAKELATNVAERVYRSENVTKSLEALSINVGVVIGKRIELATLDAAQPTMRCVRAFLGHRYGQTVATIVSRDTGKEFDLNPKSLEADINKGDILISGSGAIAGAVILMVRRTVANMARRVGQRVVGAVLGRLVSVVAGGIGLILIAKDIWDMRNGVLPIIAAEMKSDTSNEKIREELSGVLKTQLADQAKILSAQTADKVVGIWQEFRRVHAKVVELSAKHEGFKAFLDTVNRDDMPRLDRVAAIVLANEGEDGVIKRLADGTLNEAVKKMGEDALQIAEDTNSLEESFGWIKLTNAKLKPILDHDIHRQSNPDQFSKPGLAKLLTLDDPLAITRLTALTREMRAPLFELEGEKLKKLAREFNTNELQTLSRYLTGLKPGAKSRIINAVAFNPVQFRKISSPGVREAILRSEDQQAAVNLMLRSGGLANLPAIPDDIDLAMKGAIDPMLIWEKHTLPVIVIGFIGFIFFAIFWRLLFGRRPKVIIKQSDLKQGQA